MLNSLDECRILAAVRLESGIKSRAEYQDPKTRRSKDEDPMCLND